jgi:hypothetical protein
MGVQRPAQFGSRFLFAAFFFVFAYCAQVTAQESSYQPREGDVMFQSFPHSRLTDAIEGITVSPYSHCGIVHHVDSGWVVIEAIGPVKETPLAQWIARSRDGRYAAYRLKSSYDTIIPSFIQAAEGYEGLPYDIHYDLKNESACYCSGLVYRAFLKAAHEQLGTLQKLGELNWKPYVGFIREIEDGNVPLDREMITPVSVSQAPQLQKVYPQN